LKAASLTLKIHKVHPGTPSVAKRKPAAPIELRFYDNFHALLLTLPVNSMHGGLQNPQGKTVRQELLFTLTYSLHHLSFD
jgi:hypothetical protein